MKKIDRAVEIMRNMNSDELKKVVDNACNDALMLFISSCCPQDFGLQNRDCLTPDTCEDCWNEEAE